MTAEATAPDLDDVRRLAAQGSYLTVVATTRADGSVQASVVNAGVTAHPLTGLPVVSFVTYGRPSSRTCGTGRG